MHLHYFLFPHSLHVLDQKVEVYANDDGK